MKAGVLKIAAIPGAILLLILAVLAIPHPSSEPKFSSSKNNSFDLSITDTAQSVSAVTKGALVSGETYAYYENVTDGCFMGVNTGHGVWSAILPGVSCPSSADDKNGFANALKELWNYFKQKGLIQKIQGYDEAVANAHIQGFVDLGEEYGVTLTP